jgi:caffeoyl-CoA O-methyltransferase
MPDKFVALTDAVYGYALAQRSDANDPVLAELYVETMKLGEPAKGTLTPDQVGLIGMLAALIGTKWAIEIGTFTGFASIAIARNLAPGGKLFCFDQDFRYTSIARRYWFNAGLQNKIELRLGNAHQLVPRFRAAGPLDLVFIDADKEAYDYYYESLLPLVRVNGLIIFDNMLRGGKVVDPVGRTEPGTRAVDELNRKLATDPRIQSVMIPIADGLHLVRKLERGY